MKEQLPSNVTRTLVVLMTELLDGPPGREAYMLNGGDHGLLGALDSLSAGEASELGANGSSVAAHVDHLRYGLNLMNRWNTGENPFASADWSESWRRTTVDDEAWAARRRQLRDEATRWKQVLATPPAVSEVELAGIIGSIAHMAYHLGAIRQMQPALRGPRDASA